MYTEEQASYINKQAEEIIKLKYDCNSQKKEGILIKKVCDFFDVLKDFELTQPTIQFLYIFANILLV